MRRVQSNPHLSYNANPAALVTIPENEIETQKQLQSLQTFLTHFDLLLTQHERLAVAPLTKVRCI